MKRPRKLPISYAGSEGATPITTSTDADNLKTPSPRLLDAKASGRYLGISSWSARNLGWSGQVPTVRIGRRVLFDLRDLDQYVDLVKHREAS